MRRKNDGQARHREERKRPVAIVPPVSPALAVENGRFGRKSRKTPSCDDVVRRFKPQLR